MLDQPDSAVAVEAAARGGEEGRGDVEAHSLDAWIGPAECREHLTVPDPEVENAVNASAGDDVA